MTQSDVLKPCPFCGGEAEMDTMRAYRSITQGHLGTAVAIYCLQCAADMTMCREDHPGMDTEDMIYVMREEWNRRAADPGRRRMREALRAIQDRANERKTNYAAALQTIHELHEIAYHALAEEEQT